MQKLNIGVAGTIASGKTTVAKVIRGMFEDTETFRCSDPLRMFYGLLRGLVLTFSEQEGTMVPTHFVGRRHTLLAHMLELSFGDGIGALGTRYIAFNQFALWLTQTFIPLHEGRWPEKASTKDLQTISTSVRSSFGEDVIERFISARIESSRSQSPIVVTEGIRLLVDIGRFVRDRSIPFLFIYVEADPEVRYSRHGPRNEKQGDNQLTYEQFKELGRQETEQQIVLLRPYADLIIDTSHESKEANAERVRVAVQARLAQMTQ